MAANSKIEWCDHTFNPWIGCTKVAAGCEHCYAESFAKRFGKAVWGPGGTRVKTSDANWRLPLKWNREAQQRMARDEDRPRVFCASLADVFEDWQGPIHNSRGSELWHTPTPAARGQTTAMMMDDLRRAVFALIDSTPYLDWLLLTKRPENILQKWPSQWIGQDGNNYYNRIHNIWLLTSISTQADADRNIPHLIACRDLVPVLGLSCEPLLGHLTLSSKLPALDWLIVGGESGPHARPMHPDWVRSLRDQCQAAGVPFFFKQWGEWCGNDTAAASTIGWAPCGADRIRVWPDRNEVSLRIGKQASGRLLDGREWNEGPATQTLASGAK